jgi:deoxyhypusine monooxygenase
LRNLDHFHRIQSVVTIPVYCVKDKFFITMWTRPSFSDLEECLLDPFKPIGMRMRAAYYLKQEYLDTEKNAVNGSNLDRRVEVVSILCKGLLDGRHGSLMRHEIAYVMGQIRDKLCCPSLEHVLSDSRDCSMVRHEAAEALAAIGLKTSIPIITSVMQETENSNQEIYETCLIALDVIAWREQGSDPDHIPAACSCMISPYSSIDPAPPHPAHSELTIKEIGEIVRNAKLPMFERYRAMFSLRNQGGSDAVGELCKALTTDTSSALFRHEVAYVLGQMQHPKSVAALEESLRNANEHKMVRHESAEALGAIEERWEDVELILKEFANDENDVIRDSCLVALDAADYWGYNQQQEESLLSDAAEKIPPKERFALQKAYS